MAGRAAAHDYDSVRDDVGHCASSPAITPPAFTFGYHARTPGHERFTKPYNGTP